MSPKNVCLRPSRRGSSRALIRTPSLNRALESIVDFKPIFAVAEATGAEWYIAEQDWTARPPLESAALSLKHLKEWGKL